ncbi:MAG: RNA polymerase sigma factor [Planctomycetota bacterium]|jgi:RNA polymerase sigma-70 factor (ECF subfamily)
MDRRSDEDWVRRAKQGEEEAFFALYERYKGTVFRFARRMLGEEALAADAVQDTFEYFFRKIPEFRFEAKITTLLLKATRNRCLNVLEKRRRRDGGSLEETGEVADQREGDPLALAEQGDLSRTAEEALQSLPEMYREVIVLKILKDLSYEEIGEILECPPGTVKSRLHNGLERLRKKMRFL